MVDIPASEWNCMWQCSIQWPGPTESPAITWAPNESPGPSVLLSMIGTWSANGWPLLTTPVRVSAQECPCRWKVCMSLPMPTTTNSTRSPLRATRQVGPGWGFTSVQVSVASPRRRLMLCRSPKATV
ncbi:hypothetical protein GCM10010169_46400 [Micromonospora fulviviridis]|nr:hypothetical protein GCM10010169_46400 [Micromonospora fulviviridis]